MCLSASTATSRLWRCAMARWPRIIQTTRCGARDSRWEPIARPRAWTWRCRRAPPWAQTRRGHAASRCVGGPRVGTGSTSGAAGAGAGPTALIWCRWMSNEARGPKGGGRGGGVRRRPRQGSRKTATLVAIEHVADASSDSLASLAPAPATAAAQQLRIWQRRLDHWQRRSGEEAMGCVEYWVFGVCTWASSAWRRWRRIVGMGEGRIRTSPNHDYAKNISSKQ